MGRSPSLLVPRSVPAFRALVLALALVSAGARAQGNQPIFDIGTSGTASITGTLNGSVTVNPNLLFLEVAVNFGEVSPINRNGLVRVTVPVIIRTEGPYQVVAAVTASSFGTQVEDLRLSDVGMGILNMRPLTRGEVCSVPHTVQAPFNTDPALSMTQTPRVTYPGNLSLLTTSRVVLTGPEASDRNVKLNRTSIPGNQRENGWQFDLVLTLVPQFFDPGPATATLILSIARGPNPSCP